MVTVSFFARLFRIAPAPPAPLADGTRALQAGRLDDAAAAFAGALAAATAPRDRALALNKLALVALARGSPDAAAAYLAQALDAYPACVPAMVNQGNLLLEAGRAAEAVPIFERAIILDPDYPEAHHNLGVAFRRLGRRADAVRELRRATGLERRRKKQDGA
jgi:tetratricopeptide (TPR) repeat protein